MVRTEGKEVGAGAERKEGGMASPKVIIVPKRKETKSWVKVNAPSGCQDRKELPTVQPMACLQVPTYIMAPTCNETGGWSMRLEPTQTGTSPKLRV